MSVRQKRVLGTWGGIAVSGDGDGSGAASLYRARVSEAESSSADDGARSRLHLIVLESGKALVGPTELGVSSQRLLFPDMGIEAAPLPCTGPASPRRNRVQLMMGHGAASASLS